MWQMLVKQFFEKNEKNLYKSQFIFEENPSGDCQDFQWGNFEDPRGLRDNQFMCGYNVQWHKRTVDDDAKENFAGECAKHKKKARETWEAKNNLLKKLNMWKRKIGMVL